MVYSHGIRIDNTAEQLPIGSICQFPVIMNRPEILLADGSTFDETEYPELFELLGTNVLPDYREVIFKGVGQNTTDTITSHDVYALNEFKDDALQSHTHTYTSLCRDDNYSCIAASGVIATARSYHASSAPNSTGVRIGNNTRSKHKGVYNYIKAK